jgi:hypothetical protein
VGVGKTKKTIAGKIELDRTGKQKKQRSNFFRRESRSGAAIFATQNFLSGMSDHHDFEMSLARTSSYF